MNVIDILIPEADYPRLRAGHNLHLRTQQDLNRVVVLQADGGTRIDDDALVVIPVGGLMQSELASGGSTGYASADGIFSIRVA